MFRIIRRAPWIALGAAAAYYMDSDQGASRRDRALGRARELTDDWKRRVSGETPAPVRGADDGPLQPSVGADSVSSRAEQPLAEETSAGVAASATPAMAQEILQESERRVTDRAGTEWEHRASEDTVDPVDPSAPVGAKNPVGARKS